MRPRCAVGVVGDVSERPRASPVGFGSSRGFGFRAWGRWRGRWRGRRRSRTKTPAVLIKPTKTTRARVRDCAPTNNTHPTTQRRRRRRRRRARHRRFPSPRERRRERTRERKGRTRGFLDGGIAPKGAQTHSRRPTSAHKQGRRQKILITNREERRGAAF